MLKFAKRNFTLARVFDSTIEAISDIRSGSSIAVGGFMSVGAPDNLLAALKSYGNYDFNVVSMGSCVENYGINKLISNSQVKRLITSFTGGIEFINSQYHNGELELEILPSGTLAEKIRAAGAGIPGFWTTTGVGTIIEHGGVPIKYRKGGAGVSIYSEPREKRIFNKREHLYEESIKTEYSLIKAWKADALGNLVYRRTAKNINPDMAICSKITIAEVEEIVPVGALDPDEIDTPSIFVQRLVKVDRSSQKLPGQKLYSEEGVVIDPEDRKKSLNIAKRVAKELKPGMFVKLDMGIPSLAYDFLEPGVSVVTSSGIVGAEKLSGEIDPDVVDTSGKPASIEKGGVVLSSNTIMDILRGGHIDTSVLGGFEVSSSGDLANWHVPGVHIRGIGSSMDSVANKDEFIIVAMTHTFKNRPKIVTECKLPLTGKNCVKMLVTELGVFDFRDESLNLREIAKGVTLDEIRSKTACGFTISSDLKEMAV